MISEFPTGIPSDINSYIGYIYALIGVWILGYGLDITASVLGLKVFSSISISASDYAIKQLTKHDLEFFKNNHAGSLTSKIGDFISNSGDIVDTIIYDVLQHFISLMVACVILWNITPYLTLTILAFIPVFIFIMLPKFKKRGKYAKNSYENYNAFIGGVSDVISNINTVKSSGNTQKEASKQQKVFKKYIDSNATRQKYNNYHVLSLEFGLVVLINILGIFIALNHGAMSGDNIAGVFITFSYFTTASYLFLQASNSYRNVESLITGASEFIDIVNAPILIESSDKSIKLSRTPEIKFINASFAYPDGKEDNSKNNVFDDLSLTLKNNEKVGVVGRSGAGKSSLINLLLRFYDVDEGKITFDGKNIQDYSVNSIRKNISYVAQESEMFHRTIRENISYGIDGVTDKEIISAAKKAHAYEFISSLEKGLDTMVGERGIKLSGGQRQRIVLTRAFLKNAPILILDEATSALDSESEEIVQNSLKDLMNKKTTLVIAHRLSTLKQMDRIIVLDKGEIVESGTHTELLKNDGIYSNLWSKQTDWALED